MTTYKEPDIVKDPELDWPGLRKVAKGKWSDIFQRLLGKELGPAMGNAPYHVSCPVHGGDDGYRLFEHYNDTGRGVCNTCGVQKSGFDTLVWIRQKTNPGYTVDDAGREVARWHSGEFNSMELPPLKIPELRKIDPEVARAKIFRVLAGCYPWPNTPIERYLINRGIWLEHLSSAVKAHPGLDYYDEPTKKVLGTYPCLIAPMKDVHGAIVSLQRIYLTEDGEKAPVPKVKKMMSACADIRGSSVQLFPPEETLAVVEGIETGYAVHAITGLPVWAATVAGLLEVIELPPCVKRVVIFADLDRSMRGQIAAERLAARLEAKGIIVEVYYPEGPIPEGKKGIDWLRVLITRGILGFPAKWRKWRPASAEDRIHYT